MTNTTPLHYDHCDGTLDVLHERGWQTMIASPAVQARQTTVLVVDDDQAIADLLAEVLQDAGYRVLTAGNGESGYVVARALHPAIILTDYMMPQMNGEQLVQALQGQHATRDIPVVLMSSTRPSKAELRCVPFLPKPFDIDDVLDIVESTTSAPTDGTIQ
jgi:two-component system, OmpR family, response regulator VicR